MSKYIVWLQVEFKKWGGENNDASIQLINKKELL